MAGSVQKMEGAIGASVGVVDVAVVVVVIVAVAVAAKCEQRQ